jgi:hypothetical protein
MKTNKDLENISKILRDHLHLSAEEVEGFLAGSLDPESTSGIENHLRSCHHCAREMDLIREIVSEQEPGAEGLFDRLGIGKILPLRPKGKTSYDRFWIGDENYLLSQTKEHRDLQEVKGLYLRELLKRRREDRNDPGSVPVAVEGPGRPPVIALLSSFETAGDFKDPFEDEPPESGRIQFAALSSFAPILADVSPLAMGRRLKALPGKGRKEKKPRPKLILTCRAKSHSLELFHDPESDSIFLKIQGGETGRK